MPAGPVKFLSVDSEPLARESWQLAKSPTIVQTPVTAAKLCQNLRDVSFDEDTFEVIDVSDFHAIRLEVWGDAADNDAPVIDLYGWSENGPGAHIGKVTLAYGAFTSAANTGFHASTGTHRSIRGAFAAGTAYRGCDTYTVTNDYEQQIVTDTNPVSTEQYKSLSAPRTLASPAVSPVEVNFPSFLTVDFSRSRYKFFCVAVTALGATGVTLGAIFRPLGYRGNV